MKRRIRAAILLLLLLLSSCGNMPEESEANAGVSTEQRHRYVIGVSFPTTNLAFRSTMLKLLEEYEDQNDQVELVILDGESSQRKQNEDSLPNVRLYFLYLMEFFYNVNLLNLILMELEMAGLITKLANNSYIMS